MASTILSLELTTGGHVYHRTYLATTVPSEEEFLFYYTTICGFKDAVVKRTVYEVQQGFNESLLTPLTAAPTVFPTNNLVTDVGSGGEVKRKQYNDFIAQLVEMEHNRIALNFFPPSENSPQKTFDNPRLRGFRSWVHDLLETLSLEKPAEKAGKDPANPTVGWVIVPTSSAVRETHGCKVIYDRVVGDRWESLLGTDHFPDFVVHRELTTMGWNFDGQCSTTFLTEFIQWYLHAKGVATQDFVSTWVKHADSELVSLAHMFRHIRGGDAIPAMNMPPPPPPVFYKKSVPVTEELGEETGLDILSQIESALASATVLPEHLEACSKEIFNDYVDVMFEIQGIPRASIHNPLVQESVKRWASDKMGFRPDKPPICEEYTDAWNAIIRTNASQRRVRFFLDSVRTMRAHTLHSGQKDAFVKGWIDVFMETFCVPDVIGKVQSTELHQRCREFCLKFVPSGFAASFTPMSIGPHFKTRGFDSVKKYNGRFTMGIRFRSEGDAPWIVNTITNISTIHMTKESSDTMMKEQTIVESSTVENGIEHFYSATVTNEIHLGRI